MANNTSMNLEQELNKLKNEIDRLREPPLEVAVIIDIINKKKRRCAVLISSGSLLLVNASRRIQENNLKRGIIVASSIVLLFLGEIFLFTSNIWLGVFGIAIYFFILPSILSMPIAKLIGLNKVK